MELETAGGEGVAAERLTPDLELRSVYRDFLRSLSFPTKTLLHYLSSPRCINRRRRYTRLEATLQWTSNPNWGEGGAIHLGFTFFKNGVKKRGLLGSCSLKKQPSFRNATTGSPAKWRLKNERRNSILKMRHYPDLGNASDWSCHANQPIRSTTHIWVVTHHQYGNSALVSKTSFRGETSSGVAKCRLLYRLWLMRT